MKMQAALVSRLTRSAAITALVESRVSWFGRQRGDGFPAITLTLVSLAREWTHGGPDNLDRPRVQIDCWATDDAAAWALADAVRAVMERGETARGIQFHPAMLTGSGADEEQSADGGARIYRVRQDYQFYFQEA